MLALLPTIAALLVPSTLPPAHVPAAIMRAAPAPIVQQHATSAVFPTTELIAAGYEGEPTVWTDEDREAARFKGVFTHLRWFAIGVRAMGIGMSKEDTEKKIKKIRVKSEMFMCRCVVCECASERSSFFCNIKSSLYASSSQFAPIALKLYTFRCEISVTSSSATCPASTDSARSPPTARPSPPSLPTDAGP